MEHGGGSISAPVATSTSEHDVWWRPRWVYASALLLCGASSAGSLALFTWGEVPKLWVTPVSVLAAIAIIWPRQRHHPERIVAAAIVIPLLLLIGAMTLSGLDVVHAAWLSGATTLQALFMALAYQLWLRKNRWTPLVPGDMVRMALSFVAASALLVWLGVLPGTHPLVFDVHNLLWLLRTATDSLVGALTLPILWWYPTSWRPTLTRDLGYLALLLPLVLALSFFLYNYADVPTSWMVVFPALWAGWVMSPRGAAAYTFLMAVGVLLLHVDLHNAQSAGMLGPLPATVLVEFMVVASSLTCLGFSLANAQAQELRESLGEERRHASEQALMLSGVFQSMSDGVLVFDDEGGTVVYNPAVVELLGSIPQRPLTSWTRSLGLVTEDGHSVRADDPVFRQVFAGQPSTRLWGRVVEGRRLWLQVVLTPLVGGSVPRALVVVRDVTLERQKADELRSFAGVVTHDLRTPLTGLHGWLEVLSDELGDHDNPAVAKALESAVHGSRRLRSTIDDWLTFTVERDSQLVLHDLDLSEVITESLAELGSTAIDVTIAAPHRVMGDRAVLRQVFLNLGANAVKYARPRHRPTLHVASRLDPDNTAWVQIDLRDNGRGIPAGEEEAIFEEFHRASAHAAQVEGAGVGLALCRRAIERHGGTIRARSNEDGPGSTFTLTLPGA